jgi:hypothetical protein
MNAKYMKYKLMPREKKKLIEKNHEIFKITV